MSYDDDMMNEVKEHRCKKDDGRDSIESFLFRGLDTDGDSALYDPSSLG